MTSRRPTELSVAVGAALSVLLAVGALLWMIEATPWLLMATAFGAVVIAVWRHATGAFAVASASVSLVIVGVLVARAAPMLGASLEVTAFAGLLGVGLLAAATLLLPGRHRPERPEILRGAVAAAIPLAAVVVWIVGGPGGDRGLAWAVRGDAVWNTMMARFIIDDGGLRSDLHPNPSPAASVLLAIVASVGRGAASPDVLQHDANRLGQLWIVLFVLASALAALVAVHTTKLSLVGRILAGTLAALVPLSWYVAGFAWELGFLNAPLAVALLCATWIAWGESRIAPLRGAVLLSLGAVALLATWAPLAIIPALLAAAALVADRRRLRTSVPALLGWLAAAIPVPLYALTVTLEDLRREGAALSVDGGFPALSASDGVVTACIALAVIVLVAVRDRDPHRIIGVATIAAATAIAVGYLLIQRAPTGVLWGYYPAKMTWLVLIVLIVIAIGSLGAALTRPSDGRTSPAGIAFAAVGAVAIAACTMLVPPLRQPISQNVIPWLDLARGTGVASPVDLTDELFALAEPGEKVLVSRFGEHDGFTNFWLLQSTADSGSDSVRTYAYILDPTSAAHVCEAIAAWGGDVRVHTRDPQLASELDANCGDIPWAVELHD